MQQGPIHVSFHEPVEIAETQKASLGINSTEILQNIQSTSSIELKNKKVEIQPSSSWKKTTLIVGGILLAFGAAALGVAAYERSSYTGHRGCVQFCTEPNPPYKLIDRFLGCARPEVKEKFKEMDVDRKSMLAKLDQKLFFDKDFILEATSRQSDPIEFLSALLNYLKEEHRKTSWSSDPEISLGLIKIINEHASQETLTTKGYKILEILSDDLQNLSFKEEYIPIIMGYSGNLWDLEDWRVTLKEEDQNKFTLACVNSIATSPIYNRQPSKIKEKEDLLKEYSQDVKDKETALKIYELKPDCVKNVDKTLWKDPSFIQSLTEIDKMKRSNYKKYMPVAGEV